MQENVLVLFVTVVVTDIALCSKISQIPDVVPSKGHYSPKLQEE